MDAPRSVMHLRVMSAHARRSGSTLPELLVLLGLLAILAGMTVTASARTRDGLAVRSARDAVAAEIAKARALAVLHGSARVRVEPPDHVTVEAPIGVHVASLSLAALRVSADAEGASVALDFDGLGLGRLANRTLRFTRGEAAAGLTLSSYGRARKW